MKYFNKFEISNKTTKTWTKVKNEFHLGTYKVRNEIETKRNEINENETKSTKTKRNEINEMKTKSTKYDARLLPTHVSVSFTRRGQHLITIEQEYYAFIQQESVLFT